MYVSDGECKYAGATMGTGSKLGASPDDCMLYYMWTFAKASKSTRGQNASEACMNLPLTGQALRFSLVRNQIFSFRYPPVNCMTEIVSLFGHLSIILNAFQLNFLLS